MSPLRGWSDFVVVVYVVYYVVYGDKQVVRD